MDFYKYYDTGSEFLVYWIIKFTCLPKVAHYSQYKLIYVQCDVFDRFKYKIVRSMSLYLVCIL